MSQPIITLILSGTAIMATLALRSSRATLTHWNISSTYIFIIGWVFLIPQVLSALFMARTVRTDVNHNILIILDPWVTQLQRATNYLTVLLPVGFLAYALLKRRTSFNSTIAIAFLIATAAAISSLLAHGPLLSNPSFSLMVALFVAAFLPRGRAAAQGAAWFAITFTIVCCLLSIVNYSTVAVSCVGLYKCGPLGVFVLGALQSENAFGLLICAALPFVWLSFQGRAKMILVGYMFFMAAVSSSRTSGYAAVGVILLLVVLRPAWGQALLKGRFYVTAAATAGAFIFGVLLPFATNDPHAYTNRGLVWLIARRYLAGHYAIGLGGSSWGQLVGINQLPAYASYSTHNQWLDVLWVAGFIGALGVAIIVVQMFHAQAVVALSVLLPVVLLGISERIWSIWAFDTWTYAYIAALMAVPVSSLPHRALAISNAQLMRRGGVSEYRGLYGRVG